MNNFFYISSSGSTATAWLAKAISSHPLMNCHHGHLPGWNPDSKNWHKEMVQIFESLSSSNTKANKKLVNGATHINTIHGDIARQTVLSMGGRFAGLTREPTARISSQYISKKTNLSDTKGRENSLKKYALFPVHAPIANAVTISLQREMDLDELEFFRACVMTFLHDYTIMRHSREEEVFKFEDFTQQIDVYTSLLRFITNNTINFSDDFLEKSFNSKKINQHHSTPPKDPDYLYEMWSDVQKAIYFITFHMVNNFCKTKQPECQSLYLQYKKYNYNPLPELSKKLQDKYKNINKLIK